MFRFAEETDVPAIMKFIDLYWRSNHIMSRDRVLFEFQHKWGKEISFVLSEENNNITGILGFIPYSKNNRDVTLAIWKNNKTEDTMQGIKLLSFLRENGDVKSVYVPGINPKVIPIYKFLGFDTGKMKQWYRLRDLVVYKIAKVTNKEIPPFDTNLNAVIEEIPDFSTAETKFVIEDCLIKEHQPFKSKEYVRRRYFEHPSFTYIKYGITLGTQKLFIVLRIQKLNESAILRIIDCIGDQVLIKCFTPELDKLLQKYACEYADCYETGVSDTFFKEGGWSLVEKSGNIMPDYFAPFEKRNIDIYYAAENKGVSLFKGDGDMDRPN